MEEKSDRTVTKDELQLRLITENLSALAYTVEAQNAVILALVHNLKKQHGFDIPDWKDKAEVETDIGDILSNCVKKVNELYGLGKTDKS